VAKEAVTTTISYALPEAQIANLIGANKPSDIGHTTQKEKSRTTVVSAGFSI
jgi:hypothetical protein